MPKVEPPRAAQGTPKGAPGPEAVIYLKVPPYTCLAAVVVDTTAVVVCAGAAVVDWDVVVVGLIVVDWDEVTVALLVVG